MKVQNLSLILALAAGHALAAPAPAPTQGPDLAKREADPDPTFKFTTWVLQYPPRPFPSPDPGPLRGGFNPGPVVNPVFNKRNAEPDPSFTVITVGLPSHPTGLPTISNPNHPPTGPRLEKRDADLKLDVRPPPLPWKTLPVIDARPPPFPWLEKREPEAEPEDRKRPYPKTVTVKVKRDAMPTAAPDLDKREAEPEPRRPHGTVKHSVVTMKKHQSESTAVPELVKRDAEAEAEPEPEARLDCQKPHRICESDYDANGNPIPGTRHCYWDRNCIGGDKKLVKRRYQRECEQVEDADGKIKIVCHYGLAPPLEPLNEKRSVSKPLDNAPPPLASTFVGNGIAALAKRNPGKTPPKGTKPSGTEVGNGVTRLEKRAVGGGLGNDAPPPDTSGMGKGPPKIEKRRVKDRCTRIPSPNGEGWGYDPCG